MTESRVRIGLLLALLVWLLIILVRAWPAGGISFPVSLSPDGNEALAFLATIETTSFSGQVILTIELLPFLLIAGMSEAIGQSYVLLANRVRPLRFALSILINVLIFVLGYFVTVFAIWFTGRFVFGYAGAVQQGMFAVALSYLPLWFAFLTALPYFGSYITYLLYFIAYSLLTNYLVAFGYTRPEAIFSVALSLVWIFVMRATVGRPVIWIVERVRNLVAGTQLQRSIEDALMTYGDYFIDANTEEQR